jgi:hypothetical protein
VASYDRRSQPSVYMYKGKCFVANCIKKIICGRIRGHNHLLRMSFLVPVITKCIYIYKLRYCKLQAVYLCKYKVEFFRIATVRILSKRIQLSGHSCHDLSHMYSQLRRNLDLRIKTYITYFSSPETFSLSYLMTCEYYVGSQSMVLVTSCILQGKISNSFFR